MISRNKEAELNDVTTSTSTTDCDPSCGKLRLDRTSPKGSTVAAVLTPITATILSAARQMDRAKDVLRKWGQKVAEGARKAEDLAGNTWQHCPSIADAAIGRIAQGTKVLAEGGEEKIFRRTFETIPEEKLLKSYSCYLSTTAGPVMGVIYLSTAKLAFCSADPIACQAGEQTEYSYYKVVIQRHQLKGVVPSTSTVKPDEKYIQAISIDNHEFWFMGFLHYESAVKNLGGAVPTPVPALSSYLHSNNIEF